MQDFEKLGVFYLGKEYDMKDKELLDNLVLYKSKNLTTHAVIIGMTGSGKTGLGISLLEEAAIDNIPIIVIDPKGDMGNMALSFPNLNPKDFEPWINPNEADAKGFSVKEYAKKQSKLWEDGIGQWGQEKDRIKRYKDSANIKVYTPGGSSGILVSALKSFVAPSKEILEDRDAFSDKITSTATSLLGLIGVDSDPIINREHILISNILEHEWSRNENLALEELINLIQSPPIDRIGVMSVENFYSAKDRFTLAMKLNNLLASPSFKAWLEGVPLDINSFLYSKDGKPNISIFSISHLPENERMFFISMLLNETIAWMRTQPGTGSLRAILYMDEMHGYLPPVANPPSKKPFMTLLKQARAYGLGLVLATQNPVDLDYKALSNTGTWFIGRLQTERDKARVLAGLEGVAAGGDFDKKEVEQTLAGLSQRLFYLHNVHAEEPFIFHTRWALSYLAGPLTRSQIAMLPKEVITQAADNIKKLENKEIKASKEQTQEVKLSDNIFNKDIEIDTSKGIGKPIISSDIKQVFFPLEGAARNASYYAPNVIGLADVRYTSSKYGINESERQIFKAPLRQGPIVLDWKESKRVSIKIDEMEMKPASGMEFLPYPQEATQVKSYNSWKSSFRKFLRSDKPLNLLYSHSLKEASKPRESERDFKIRIQHLAHEERDIAIDKMKNNYASKIRSLEERERKAEQRLEQKSSLAKHRKIEAAVSSGVAIFTALLGTKSVSTTSVSKVGTAMRSANRASQSGGSIEQAEENLEAIQNQILLLEEQLQKELEEVADKYNVMGEDLENITVSATYTNITVHLIGLAWEPVVK